MSLSTPEVFKKLQAALHDKAKKSPDFLRFYALYEKVYRRDVLTFAYQCSKANGGTAGVDDQTFLGSVCRGSVGRGFLARLAA